VAHAEADEAARRRAVEDERDRIRADLHDTAGQIFVALGLLAARHAEQLPPASIEAQQALRIADVAADGKWAIDQAIRALAFVPDDRRGLLASLQSLAQRVHVDSGIDVRCESIGDTAQVDGETGRALFRVASEAVSNAWRHGRPSTIDIVLDASGGTVSMSVVDDGVGLSASVNESSGHRGITGMRRAMAAVGGTVEVHDGADGGTVVTAHVVACR
jgi:signal transduction histidine kinase